MKNVLIALTLLSSQVAISGVDRAIPEKEQIALLLEGQREVTSLDEMERLNLMSGFTNLDLWSSSYWPTYQGGIAARYREPLIASYIAKKYQFKLHKEAYLATPMYSVERDNLSPAEKYDLLVGDPLMSMTTYAWAKGDETQKGGKVPMWRGLCDGWAAASQVMPRPIRSVTLAAADGRPITFFPEDIKALGVQLYARAKKEVIFLGRRCNTTLNGGCVPFNAGAFHKVLVNRIGLQKKTFNNDLNAGKEVWNYPARSYEIKYYNVFTGEEFFSYKAAAEIYDGSSRFKNRSKIAKGTHSVVGVKATVVYSNMRTAHHDAVDTISHDQVKTMNFKYRLELDINNNVIGGEWISKGVDFVWRSTDGMYPLSFAERKTTPVTKSEMINAAQISSLRGQPLTVIVKELFERSK